MQSPFQFLIVTIFDLYLMVIMLRFFLQLFRADFYNPLSQFVVRATNPILKPLRQIIPGLGGIDISSLVFAFFVSLIKFFLLFAIISGAVPAVLKLIVISFADLLTQSVNLLFWLILVRVVMSWINPGLHNPIMAVIYQITEPLMAPVRRLLPSMGGLDLSPIILLLGMRFILMAIESWFIAPLLQVL